MSAILTHEERELIVSTIHSLLPRKEYRAWLALQMVRDLVGSLNGHHELPALAKSVKEAADIIYPKDPE